MNFIATLVSDDNTFVFRKDNTVAASGLDGFPVVIEAVPSAICPWNMPPITNGLSG